MRRLFIPQCPLTVARDLAPWAAKIVKVTGGWLAFETLGDWHTWHQHQNALR